MIFLKDVFIDTEFITLGQFLKMTDLISSGGMAKMFLATTKVYVNNELENRRGRKLYSDYIIEVIGYGKYQIKNH